MSTVPSAVLAELGVAMLEGKCKYGGYNWRIAGARASVYYDALHRHMMDWWEGTDIDPDSGLHHITKAIATLVVLRDAILQDVCVDDRPPSSAAFYADLNAQAAAVVDRYSHIQPQNFTIDSQKTFKQDKE